MESPGGPSIPGRGRSGSRTLLELLLAGAVALGLFAVLFDPRSWVPDPTSASAPERERDFPAGEGLSVEQSPRRALRSWQVRQPLAVSIEPNLFVRVQAIDGESVPDAEVVRWDPGGRELLGDTDASGHLESAVPEHDGQSLLVASDGYALAYHDLAGPFPERVTITLEAERAISGRVVDGAGAPLPGIHVLAWPVGRRPSSVEIALHASQAPLFPCSVSDEPGTFQITGISANATYGLFSGGSGYVQTSRVEVSPLARAVIRLEMWILYGVNLRILTEGDRRPIVSETVGSSAGYGVDFDEYIPILRGDPSALLQPGPGAIPSQPRLRPL